MLIDAAHPEETRVAVIDGDKLDKYDFTSSVRIQIKGNIYLGKIIKVEPSLQAAFVDFGGNKHGFLSFTEIHHDYFQIPIEDREELRARIQEAMAARAEENKDKDIDEDMDSREISRLRYQFYRRYKIQEVIKKRQIVLVQVTKEARGVKGAALTTYISLAGRYCVLMPNMAKGNGVSRKISDPKDRQKMKSVVSELTIENGSTVVRTAGVGHTKPEIKKDFEYLKNLWDEIRDKTLHSIAPSLIYEEANIIKRAIRDFYTRDVESVVVEGEQGYKLAKDLVKKLMPSHAKKVKLYDDKKLPLFSKYHINEQVNQIYSTRVELPSGGYLVINTTEALVSIDVNSGKSTRARDISGTAIKTNLEAAVEIARQCRLRDLAGLIVVDFIDMDDKRDNTQVERRLREALRDDKARIQVGSISNFGLLEFSRQRLRSSIADTNMVCCPHCNGTGVIWSDESIALQILRKIEETCMAVELSEISVTLSTEVALYLLNNKKDFIKSIEERGLRVKFAVDPAMATADFKITQVLMQTVASEYKDEEEPNKANLKNEVNKDSVCDNKKRQEFSYKSPSRDMKGKRTKREVAEKTTKVFSVTANGNEQSKNFLDTAEAAQDKNTENFVQTTTYTTHRKIDLKFQKKEIGNNRPTNSMETTNSDSNVVFCLGENRTRKQKDTQGKDNLVDTDSKIVLNKTDLDQGRAQNASVYDSLKIESRQFFENEEEKKGIEHYENTLTKKNHTSQMAIGENVNKIIETYKEVEKTFNVAAVRPQPLLPSLQKKEKKSGWWQKLLQPTKNDKLSEKE